MPSTHLSLYYHLVFSTKERRAWIQEAWQDRLFSYLGGTLRGLKGVAEEVGGTSDHVHILASLKATHCLADVLQELKSNSSAWIHGVIGNTRFSWQAGYGAFTVGRSEVETIRRYIRGQAEHHRQKTFQEEYVELLSQSGIAFSEKHLW